MNAFKAAKGIQTYVHQQHHKEFNNFIRAHTKHPVLAPIGEGLEGVWKPMFNNEQLVVLLIMMQMTTTFDTTKPSDVIDTIKKQMQHIILDAMVQCIM